MHSPGQDAKLRREGKTVDDIYQLLRDRILKGEYFPGFHLLQQNLARELNVSRTPVREALSRLQTEGLVVSEANRGTAVAPLSMNAVEQSYAARLLIEPPILESITQSIPLKKIEVMEEVLAAMERVGHRTRDFQDEHHLFHKMTHEYYPEVFRELVESSYVKISRYQQFHLSHPDVSTHFVELDRAFCAALRERNGAHVRQITEFHLADAALGVILDIDPDYRFDLLLVALRSTGITIETATDGTIARPAKISWLRHGYEPMPKFETNNLICELP